MAPAIEFARNYKDLSTDNGFQFEFVCDRCSSGHRTGFNTWVGGVAGDALRAAGNMLGGLLRRASQMGDSVRSASWERAHDAAFEEAVQEAQPAFAQCPHCTHWVCADNCWNSKRGLCKECGPDLGVEMSVAQADRSVEEIHRHARMADEDRKLSKEHWDETIVASCPECKEPLETNAKFCPGCGTKLQAARHCAECGEKVAADDKFCANCGTAAQ